MHANELTSKISKEDRNYVIKKATTPGQVTIATAAFGRGTDFFCKDRKQHDKGGVRHACVATDSFCFTYLGSNLVAAVSTIR